MARGRYGGRHPDMSSLMGAATIVMGFTGGGCHSRGTLKNRAELFARVLPVCVLRFVLTAWLNAVGSLPSAKMSLVAESDAMCVI